MRQVYLVSYDVCDPRRLRKVHKTLRGWGDAVQLSVFRCELSARELLELRRQLSALVDATEDQVLLADLGPAQGRGATCVSSLGRPFEAAESLALVV